MSNVASDSLAPHAKDVTITVTVDDLKRIQQHKERAPPCQKCGERGHVREQCKYWKTKLCWHWEQPGFSCRWSDSCSFAHGEADQRHPRR